MDYGLRVDGTAKGVGFLGEIKTFDGNVMTELSVGVDIDGQEIEIPTIVPTLTKSEIESLALRNEDTPIPDSIIQKAVDHARMRRSNGFPVFADDIDKELISDYRSQLGLE